MRSIFDEISLFLYFHSFFLSLFVQTLFAYWSLSALFLEILNPPHVCLSLSPSVCHFASTCLHTPLILAASHWVVASHSEAATPPAACVPSSTKSTSPEAPERLAWADGTTLGAPTSTLTAGWGGAGQGAARCDACAAPCMRHSADEMGWPGWWRDGGAVQCTDRCRRVTMA